MPKEKHGGLWEDGTPENGWSLVFEHFDEKQQLVGAVFHKKGLFRAVLYEKGADPQWRLPWWSERRPEALFKQESEAVEHVHHLLAIAASQT